MANKRIAAVILFVLLLTVLSTQVGAAQARSYSTIEQDGIKKVVPEFTFSNLTDGSFKLMFANGENETHYQDGKVSHEISIATSASMTTSFSTTTTKITTVLFTPNDKPDPILSDPYETYFLSNLKINFQKPEPPFLCNSWQPDTQLLSNWIFGSFLGLSAAGVGIELFMKFRTRIKPISANFLFKQSLW